MFLFERVAVTLWRDKYFSIIALVMHVLHPFSTNCALKAMKNERCDTELYFIHQTMTELDL